MIGYILEKSSHVWAGWKEYQYIDVDNYDSGPSLIRLPLESMSKMLF